MTMAGALDKIAVGSNVRVEIVKRPTNEAAVKTLRRVLAKDPAIAKQKKKDKVFRNRSESVKRRGGRPWEHRPTMRQPVQAAVGESGTVKATADVLHALRSVGRFVKVSLAGK
jgi:hypothetical protein